MTIFNPCKKCLVKSMCRLRCYKRQDFWNTRAIFFDYLGKTGCTLALITILASCLKII